ncbi:MAG TPA: thymidylate synthase [Balneolales bacterium]|nr:thymidylate synthase [Balneolales bacterium]
MRCFEGISADLVWQKAIKELIDSPDYNHSGRNSKTKEILPAILRISDPRQRWILSRTPPYNPAYGLVEFIWIITGNNASQILNFWNPGLPNFAGSGDTYHGAYGFRLRHEFGIDQIKRAYQALLTTPESRQVVLQIWKPEIDLPDINGKPVSKDIPCNLMSLLKIREGYLHWSQIMRSNDILRGLPYNIIQFTMLQEIMAGWLGVKLGDYIHLSDSLHVYEKDIPEFSCAAQKSEKYDRELFSLTYDESKVMFGMIYEDLEKVSNGNLKEDQLREIFLRNRCSSIGKCTLVQDMMAVIGSDAARRQNYIGLAYHLVGSCGDHNLKQASLAWLKHHAGRK